MTNTALTEGVWHHVAVGRTGTSLQLFLDAKPEAEANLPPQPYLGSSHRTLRFGPIAAVLDEVNLYSGFLATPEIAQIVKQGSTCLSGTATAGRVK